jgi:nucleotide-binding universal stress UspA family protein
MFEKVLVPLDGSELAEAVLPHVEELVKRGVSEIILLRVVRVPQDSTIAPLYQPSLSLPGSADDEALARHPIYREKEMETLRSEAEHSLTPAKERLSQVASNIRVEVAFGRPARRIVEFAEKEGVDLLVISSHGRTGFGRWVFGGTADRVLRATTIPVLLVRPPGIEQHLRLPGVETHL